VSSLIDPIQLAQELIRFPSVTPKEAGALDHLQSVLERLGFICHRLPFSDENTPDVDNLYARFGTGAPHFCFAGHIDVVPVGAPKNWSVDPFAGVIEGGHLIGRGACDMKSSIAAFVAAVSNLQPSLGDITKGSVSLLITGDEEGPAINGTVKMLQWLEQEGEKIDHCLVGEPTAQQKLGDMVKIGRRGSLNARLTSLGAQGHVAYPHLADNPVPRLLTALNRLSNKALDEGTEHFQPSNFEVVTIDAGNSATNVIPASVTAGFNIRFNNLHSEASLITWIEEELTAVQKEMGGAFDLHAKASGEAFLTEPCAFTELVSRAVEKEMGYAPVLSTDGGTSDARFITHHCPVIELGLVGQSMHKSDEMTPVQDIENLTAIYQTILSGYFDKVEMNVS
jgi:succinyl-diaminopimelate desuccinylase